MGTMVVGIGLEVLRPWPTKLLVDQVLSHRSMPHALGTVVSLLPGADSTSGLLPWVCASTVIVFLLHAIMALVSMRVAVAVAQRMTYQLSGDLFMHLQRLSVLFHSRRSVGDTIARVAGDTYCVQAFVTGTALPLLQSSLTLVAMLIVMWRLNTPMTLLALGVAPIMALSIWVFSGPMYERNRKRRDLEGEMMSVLEQTLNAIPVVQAFTREDVEGARFQRLADRTVAEYRRATDAEMAFKLCVGLVTAVGVAGLMWLGGRAVLDGTITVGTLLVFLTYVASLYEPLNLITHTASTLQAAAANADRVIEMLDINPDVADSPDARDILLRGRVQLEAVTFGYEAGAPAVRDISLDARPGEVIAIVGPSGAGKSTLASLLVRFFDPWSGRVLLDGIDGRSIRVRSLRRQVAIVLQDTFLFPLSIAENIAYGRPDATRDEVIAAATAASADAFVRRLPNGYDTVLGERGATLSGGEKQRIAIARAFLKDAPILILDEPTSALDARTESTLLDALGRLMQGRTTFVIAHRLSTILSADRIVVMEHGAMIECGTHKELIARGGLYARLYGQQLQIAADIVDHHAIAVPAGSWTVSSDG
jgi:ATP-binding cassette subfamily B protein/subfamily B ATP-binding cassette protein MsbA